MCIRDSSHAVYDRGSLNVYLSSLEEQMPGCPLEKGTEVILRFICRLSDRERAAVSVRGSVKRVYEKEEKGDEICRQFPGGWPAVSYTHLDVYKRQRSSSIMRKRSWSWALGKWKTS